MHLLCEKLVTTSNGFLSHSYPTELPRVLDSLLLIFEMDTWSDIYFCALVAMPFMTTEHRDKRCYDIKCSHITKLNTLVRTLCSKTVKGLFQIHNYCLHL